MTQNKVSECVKGCFGGVFMMFPDGFDAFWESGGGVEAVSGKFSGNLKVAHGDSATDEPKKSRF